MGCVCDRQLDESTTGAPQSRSRIRRDDDENLPPMIVRREADGGVVVAQSVKISDSGRLIEAMKEDSSSPLVFVINQHCLMVYVQIVHLDCCINKTVWCFTTSGLGKVGQSELIFVMEYLPNDTAIPIEILEFFDIVYQEAEKGNIVSHLGFTHLGNCNFLGSPEHGGILYIRPSFQCVRKLILPDPPGIPLFMVLVHRFEIPWLRNLPLRLMLRLGLEERYYPCPIVSRRFRQPVFNTIGNTITNLLCDFKNYTYQFPWVQGASVQIEQNGELLVKIPTSKHSTVVQILKACGGSPNSVVPIGADFCVCADSHLTVVQTGNTYITSGISKIADDPQQHRKVTGATFIIFNGKTVDPKVHAQSAIIEDGVIIMMSHYVMQEVIQSIQDMRDYTIHCDRYQQLEDGLHSGRRVRIQWIKPSDYVDDLLAAEGYSLHSRSTTMEMVSPLQIQDHLPGTELTTPQTSTLEKH